ncbi:hypothetical protein E2C01_007322 [Portunus trituberculatus]|uniref:Uncharacterized protein n=1 Tax=Portunus trituberculatus TaxID=210409 RepID=A0A5B7D0U8_PORTR|nr:hypothetical protein [Portunus trituberculatus]
MMRLPTGVPERGGSEGGGKLLKTARWRAVQAASPGLSGARRFAIKQERARHAITTTTTEINLKILNCFIILTRNL